MKNKHTHKLLFMPFAMLLMLISVGLFAGNDTTGHGNGNAGDIAQFFDALFSILLAVGVPVPAWVKLLIPIVGGWLIHFITKKVANNKAADKVAAIVSNAPATELHPEHRNALLRLADKLRGRKTNGQ